MINAEEREFLHALATPLATAILLVDSLHEGLRDREHLDSMDEKQFAGLIRTLETLQRLLKERQATVSR